MKFWKCLCVCAVVGSASAPGWACYIVYDAADRILYRSNDAPVDMSRPLHETLPARFPGGHLVFDVGSACETVAAGPRPAPRAGVSPLFTDRATARAMGARYTLLSGNVVLVRPASMDADVMTPVATQSENKPATVITELHTPPVTIVETDRGVTISRLSR